MARIVENINAVSINHVLLNILYEFDNIILSMREELLSLPESILREDGKFTHHSDNKDVNNPDKYNALNKKITKAKKIKFVSIEKAKGDLLD